MAEKEEQMMSRLMWGKRRMKGRKENSKYYIE